MPEYQVLRCVQCSAFQVHQCKRATAKRWQCSLCGLNQSYQRVYAQGAAKACREAAQQFNMRRGEVEQAAAVDFNEDEGEAQNQKQMKQLGEDEKQLNAQNEHEQASEIDWNVFL